MHALSRARSSFPWKYRYKFIISNRSLAHKITYLTELSHLDSSTMANGPRLPKKNCDKIYLLLITIPYNERRVPLIHGVGHQVAGARKEGLDWICVTMAYLSLDDWFWTYPGGTFGDRSWQKRESSYTESAGLGRTVRPYRFTCLCKRSCRSNWYTESDTQVCTGCWRHVALLLKRILLIVRNGDPFFPSGKDSST